ncbi:MAG: hypothetical protein AAGU27_28440 [Dehalobacterium sp.]
MAKGGALVAEFGEFVTMYGAQLENKAIAVIDKGSNWLKNKLGGSSGQDPNKFKKVPEDKVVNASKQGDGSGAFILSSMDPNPNVRQFKKWLRALS